MKPVRLTLQAFGPYAEREVIDFRDAVEAGLFGIYGQTGSGKSSIFSAMTFALFGAPANDQQNAPSLRSDHADPSLLTEVEFVFDLGPKRYVVVRRPDQMRPKQRGNGETKSPHEAFLFDATGKAPEDITEAHRGTVIAEKKVGVVDEAITQRLGYRSDQFRQIVLLPQGRFETFLSAKTRDRMDILRDLFDVELYRSLTEALKSKARAEEDRIRSERDLCTKRLNAEGFETPDNLHDGIAQAEQTLATLQQQEADARTAVETARTTLQAAKEQEQHFVDAERARTARDALTAQATEMDHLATHITVAEKARSLGDVERQMNEAIAEENDADARQHQASKALEITAAKKDQATAAWQTEQGKDDERDTLRRQIDTLTRHARTLDKATTTQKALRTAEQAEQQAKTACADSKTTLDRLKDERHTISGQITQARADDQRRQDASTRRHTLQTALSAAEAFEAAEKDVQAATKTVAEKTTLFQQAQAKATAALVNREAAEQAVARSHALHLAASLHAGDPCPVCGSTDHPSPATGTAEEAGLEQALRTATTAWEEADRGARKAEQGLIAARSVADERTHRLQAMPRPETPADMLRADLVAVEATLKALADHLKSSELEQALSALDARIAEAEATLDTHRGTLTTRQQDRATQTAHLQTLLADIPDTLRTADALRTQTQSLQQTLTNRQAQRTQIEQAARTAHDLHIAATKDLEARNATLASCQDRRTKAIALFQERLKAAGLDEATYEALKPGLPQLDADKKRLEAYRQAVSITQDRVTRTAAAIADRTRPDLPPLDTAVQDAATRLTEATDQRAKADHDLAHLHKLHDDLADTLRILDEAEAQSGPLRALAALTRGDNSQKIDLETFAIGAMFDQVLLAANQRLAPMTADRYQLERDLEGSGNGRRGLGIQVFDLHTGKARPTSTLSGGETFIAALALALGLADVVEQASGKVRLDTIFIDEGFGSLDSDSGSGTLDQVLQVLNTLVSRNRAVGLISHVPVVQEAIPNGFYVQKYLDGSHVETRGSL